MKSVVDKFGMKIKTTSCGRLIRSERRLRSVQVPHFIAGCLEPVGKIVIESPIESK